MPTPEFIRRLRAHVGTELLLVPTVAVVARDAAGRLLLVRDRDSGLWGFPGGIVEPLELPADAAVRETWEEAGVEVELTRIVGVFGGPACTTTYANGDRLAWVATVFAARVAGGRPRPDTTETSDARLVTDDEFSAMAIRDHALHFLAAERSGASGAAFARGTWQP
jgi:ADP-ribose pyrophosphatase YjhB (NUDIX family)